jgi:hypothetical protein
VFGTLPPVRGTVIPNEKETRMPFEPEPDEYSGILAGIFETILTTGGLPKIGKSEILLIIYLWSRGYIETNGIPEKERFIAGDAIGLRRSATYGVFRILMKVGLLRRTEVGTEVRYGLNTCWIPSWLPALALALGWSP